jgi:lauroyl/myristoyl acyltransferase
MIAYYLYQLGYFISTRLPLRAAYAIATYLSLLKYYISPRDRHAVKANLRVILPPERHAEIDHLAQQVFINFGKYLIEFFRFKYVKKTDLGGFMKIKNLATIDEALKKGKGVIILSAHMGNWELGGIFMSLLGYPMFAVALPHQHRKVNEFFNRQRQRAGVEVVPSLGAAIRRVYHAVQNNKLVAVVGDRDFAHAGIKMDFLGAQKVMPRGPAVLAMRTGATVVPGFMVRQPDDTHVLEFQEPICMEGTELDIVRRFASSIEKMIYRYPDQWLMFREFWKE